ncbi:MAG: fibronectin type III-like domain-contianing protein, partial [Coriobacteriales bacterium]|nr:fibronectin type III-like domain-contianing protein [Coriobacteriales bacterium]
TTDEGYALHFDLENAGARRAKEIVQAYVHAIDPAVFRPEQELAAFTKVLLDPGETQHITLTLDGSSFRYWDDEAHRWRVDEGAYKVKIGASSRDIRLAETIELVRAAPPLHAERRAYTDELEREQLRSYYHVTPHGFSRDEFAALFSVTFPEEPPRLPYTIDSPLKDLELTRVGRLVLRVLRHRAARQKDALLPTELVLEMLDTMPLRSMAMAAYPLELAQGLVLLLNGHPFKGVKTMLEARRP